ncbi:MAG: CAP domain-containing protein [Pseudomonadota bacterium]
MSAVSRLIIIGLLCAMAAGCGMPRFGLGLGDKPKSVPNVPRERSVDPNRAVALINAHRSDKGRLPIRHDPRLSRIAAETARELARRNTLNTEMHSAKGMADRLEAANYSASRAAENLGAGYPTLVLAVEGWKDSRRHNKNLLNRDLTHGGIGLALTDAGDFKSFWVLILATPDEPSG